MPSFPNINTLGTKPTLNGNEVIQISATEKVTLQQIINQLGFNLSSPMTGYSESTPGSLSVPVATDTLIQALGKIVSIAGSNKMVILPLSDRDGEGYYPGEIRLVTLFDKSVIGEVGGLASTISFYKNKITLDVVIWDSSEGAPPDTVTTAEELAIWVYSNNPTHWYYWGDDFRIVSGASIEFNPGDVIFHTGDSITRISIPMYYWNDGRAIFQQNTTMIISAVNITRSMFNSSSGGLLSNVTYLFSDGFDEPTDTEYQCITIQKVKSAGGLITLLVNKAGYSTYTPSS